MSALNSLLKGELSWLKDNNNLSVLKLDGIDWRDLRFPNNESYRGGWKESRPEGEGCYTWADGSTYEGAWHAGLKHGWGRYRWPNAAWYQGEWRDGLMQGYGTFESPDGARYEGNWTGNLKHGIGKKVYANGDAYEGLWSNGKADGPGRYVWHNGNQYDGEWRVGKMHGQGTLKWTTGERYDGEWQEGQEGGVGVFTWRDGSTYEGFWAGGKKTGVGVFRPAPNAPGTLPFSDASTRLPAAAAGGTGPAGAEAFDEQQQPRSPVGSPSAVDAPLDSPAASAARYRRDLLAPDGPRNGAGSVVATTSLGGGVAGGGGGSGSDLVFVCAYEGGKLVHEEALSTQDLELIFGPPAKSAVEKKRRLRRNRKRQVRLGETIYKGHRSYDLMLNLQLGIRYTITTLNKLPPPKLIGEEHYMEKVWLRFPREGSEVTPPHPSGDFKWKDYCPTAFKHLRGLFGIDNSQYILSICGDQALREMPSPGKSGSVFFISHDDQFMIKTMHKEEIKLLLSMLPKYMRHADRNPETLLTRFYGVHRVKPSHGRKVRFVVMNNVFRTDLDLHRKFDLKGSTHGRTCGPKPGASAICKDLDLDVAFHVDNKMRDRLARQLAADCAFLEDIRVMDYSMLMGVHCRWRGETSASPLNTDKEDNGLYASAEEEDERGPEEGEGDMEEVDGESEDEATFMELDAAGTGASWPPLGSARSGPSSGYPSARAPAPQGSPGGLRRGRSGVGLAVSPSDSEAEVTRSMHSLAIERDSPRESRSPSFLLKGLNWRSFTQRRPSEPQLAPASALHPGPTQQPAPSTQITPRVQPSMLPTPRLTGALPQVPILAAASSKQLQPQGVTPTFAAAIRAAAAEASAAEAGGTPTATAGWGQPMATANGHTPIEQQEGEEQPALISWRSDAVQLPEQLLQLLQDPQAAAAGAGSSNDEGLEGAPGSLTARLRGSAVPALGPIPEAPGSWRSGQEEEDEEGQRGDEQAVTAAAAVLAAVEAAGQQAAGLPSDAAAAGTPGSQVSPFSTTSTRAAVPDSPGGSDSALSTPMSSLAGTPTDEAARRGLPMPGGMPRIALPVHRTPRGQQQALQPQRGSGDWGQVAQTVSDASASAATSEQQSSVAQRDAAMAAAASPTSDASSSPKRHQPRRRTAPPVPGVGPEAGQSPGRSSFDYSMLLAGDRGGMSSAPASARSPALTPTAAASGQHQQAQQAQQQHRLAHAGSAEGPMPRGTAGAAAAALAAAATPRSTRSTERGGLSRTSSAPVGQLAQAAAAEDHRRRSAQRDPSSRLGQQARGMLGMLGVTGREASMVDLTSPEAVALQGRINSRLHHRVTDRLVQDLLKLARYRMVGAVAHSPSARYARMPTTVLAARHMRRTSSNSGGAGSGGPLRERDVLGRSSLDDEAGLDLPAGSPRVPAGGAQAPEALRLGMRVPAVAVSQQAGQQPEQVLLYFGIIDFLQEYNMRKMLEHSFKAVVQDGKTISVVEPRTYAKRFLKAMDKVFPLPPGQQQQQQQQQ